MFVPNTGKYMPRYKVTATIQWEIESEKPKNSEDLRKIAEDTLSNNFPQFKVKQIHVTRHTKNKVVLGEFSVQEVLPFISIQETKREFQIGENVFTVKMNSDRYVVFKNNLKCVACGLEGTKFVLEKHPNDKSPHFNLYGDDNGKMVLMTKDHIKPKSKGGEDSYSNYQTLCSTCNNLKSNDNLTVANVSKLRRIYDDNRYDLPRKKLADLIIEEKSKMLSEKVKLSINYPDNFLVTCCDISIVNGEELVGINSYECKKVNLEHIASIKRGTYLEPHGFCDQRVVFKIFDKTIYIHQGLFTNVKSEL